MSAQNEFHYDAFISYRHNEFDSFIAENLHKKLENFKLPKSVLSKVKSGKTNQRGLSKRFAYPFGTYKDNT
jgi:hypothetical protein